MKRLILKILLALVISNLSFVIARGQTWNEVPDSIKKKIIFSISKNKTDDKGIKQGQWTYLADVFQNPNEDSSKAEYYCIINYEDGKPKGLVKCYFLTGELKGEWYQLSENPDVYDSTFVYYYKNGQKKSDGKYVNGLLVTQRFWFDNDTEDFSYQARICISNGQYNIADSLLKITEKVCREKYGDDHWNYAKVLVYLGKLFLNTGKGAEADSSCNKAWKILEKSQGTDIRDHVEILNELGQILTELGKYELAESIFSKIVTIYEKNNLADNQDYSNLLSGLANVYCATGKYKEAESIYRKIVEITKRLSGENSLEYATMINNLGTVLWETGRYSEAEPLAKRNLEIVKEKLGENHPKYVNALNSLGSLYNYTGKYDEAEKFFLKALAADSNYLGALHNLIWLYNVLGKLKYHEDLIKKEIELARVQYGPDHPFYAMSLETLASLYEETDRLLEAESLSKEALEIRINIQGKNHPDVALMKSNLALIYVNMGKYQEAEILLNEAIEDTKESFVENHERYGRMLDLLANIYSETGRYYEAENFGKKGCEIIRKQLGENHELYALSLGNLATTYCNMGRFDECEQLYLKAADILRATFGENHPNYATLINNIGALYIDMKKYPEAEKHITESLRLKKMQSGDTSITYALSLTNLARYNRETGKYNEAAEQLQLAKDIYKTKLGKLHPGYATILINLAVCYPAMGKYVEAEKLIKESLEIQKKVFGENNLNFIKTVTSLGSIKKLLGKYEEADTVFDKLNASIMDLVKNNFPYMNEQEKLDFWRQLQKSISVYYAFASEYSNKNPDISAKMTDIMLETKGIVLNSTQKALSKMRYSRRLLDEWQSTRQFWLHLVQNPQKAKKMGISVDSVGQVAADLEKEISSQSLDFRKAFDTTTVKWQDVKKGLRPNEAAVEIIRNELKNDSVSYIILITKNDSKIPELLNLNNGKDLEENYIKKYASLIEKQRNGLRLNSNDIQNLGILYKQFWKPIKEKLSGINTVFISMDGVYNEFNPNTLLNPETEKYVLEEIDLRIVTSTRDLAKRENPLGPPLKKGEIPNVKLFGDPQFELNKEVNIPVQDTTGLSRATRNYYLGGILNFVAQRGISPLPGTKIEVKKISNDFSEKKWKVEDYTGDAALEENVKLAKNPKILHIATHGVFLKDVEYMSQELEFENKKYVENPLLRSMLLFAGAENTIRGETSENLDRDDGILTAYEAMNLDLDNTELVVLSACETGLGEVRNGEGVYGLQRAFQVAGAKSLIMSLWSVSDKATQELMTSFYDKWLSGMTKREAFRTAQLELKEKYPGFYYWGAFVMVGE